MALPDERRFTDEEVAAILERASIAESAARGQAAPASGRAPQESGPPAGLTLAQLQDVGREVGMAPEFIAEAASHVLDDRRQSSRTRRFLGLPLGVERIVHLRRRLSDEEWERVVVELREAFDTRGTLAQHGSLRQWTNGNLQVFLELSGDAQRLRLRTVKGNALARMAAGAGFLAGAGATAVGAVLTTGAIGDAGTVAGLAAACAAGVALLGGTAWGLVPWARRRQAQMATVAARVAALDRQPSLAAPAQRDPARGDTLPSAPPPAAS